MSIKAKLRNMYVSARAHYYKHILNKPRIILSRSNLSAFKSSRVSSDSRALAAFR